MNYSKLLKDPKWQRKRLLILQRDNWMCQQCQSTEKTLHVHHLAYGETPWDVDDRHLQTLCEDCHEEETHTLSVYRSSVYQSITNGGFDADTLIEIDSFLDLLRRLPLKRQQELVFEFSTKLAHITSEEGDLWLEYMNRQGIYFGRMKAETDE